MVYCTRLLFLFSLTDSFVESDSFVAKTLLLRPLNGIRVKEEVIVCEMGNRVCEAICYIEMFRH